MQRAGRPEHMARKIKIWFLLAVLAVCACGADEKAGQQTVSMYDLREAMLAADPGLPEMISVSDADDAPQELFSYLSEMDYEKVEHFFLSYSSEGKADEIAVIAVKDPADADEAEKSLQEHLKSRMKLLREYEPQEVGRIGKGQIYTRNQYAVLIVSDNSDNIKSEFNKYISDAGGKEK